MPLQNNRFLIIGGGIFIVLVFIVIMLAVSSSGKKNEGPTTLTFWQYSDNNDAFKDIVENFENENDVKINIVKKNFSSYLQDSLSEMAAGKGPDIWAAPNDWMAAYKDKLISMPEGSLAQRRKSDEEVYKELYPEVVAQNNIYDGKVYGVPLSIDTLKLFYNSGIFYDKSSEIASQNSDEADTLSGLLYEGPKNWDDTTWLARVLTNKSGSDISRAGITMGTGSVTNAVDVLSLIMLQYGTKMTSDDHTQALFHTSQNIFNGPEYPGRRALEFFSSFAKQDNENYAWNDSLGDGLRAFAEGKAAMFIGYASQEQDIKRINSKLSYSIIDVPQVKETQVPVNYASYVSYAVPKASKNQQLAWKFILSLTNQQNANMYLQNTKKPLALKDSLGENDQAITARTWYKPDPQKTDSIFKDMVNKTVSGTSAQTSIESAASQVTELLKKLQE